MTTMVCIALHYAVLIAVLHFQLQAGGDQYQYVQASVLILPQARSLLQAGCKLLSAVNSE